MNKIKFIISLVLVFAMILPMSSFALFDEMDDVCVFLSTPTLDGVIEKADGWSDPVTLDNNTLVIVNHGKHNPIDMNAKAYMAYDNENLYFAAEITEFDEVVSIENLLCESDLTEPIDGGNFGFDGDVFGITLDTMGLMTANTSMHDDNAPFYCVAFDAEGNGALYHSNGAADEIVSPEFADVKVTFTENGWNFEASVSHSVILADLMAVHGEEVVNEEFISDYLFGNVDGKMSFVYKSNRIDHEAEEVITYAEYASVAESSLDGTPGSMTFGSPVKTLGLIYYLNHEHKNSNYFFYESEEDFATFEKDGVRYNVCGECGAAFEKVVVPAVPFTDVKAGQWYEEALLRCYNWEYFKGMSETKFGPNVPMTRAMFVQVIANFWGVDTSSYACDQFTDVKPNHWYYNVVSWAYEEGITSGTGPDKFSPNKPLTRQEAAAFFVNIIKLDELYEAPTIEFDSKYTDVNQIHPWAKEPMLWAVENGIISGTSETTLSPIGQATRMQVAQMLCKFEELVVGLMEGAQ